MFGVTDLALVLIYLSEKAPLCLTLHSFSFILFYFTRGFFFPSGMFYLLIQIFVTFIQVFMLQAPFILHMDVGVEFPRQRLIQL